MGVAEKRVPTYLSVAACVGATMLAGYLWVAGAENPRRFHSSMTINKHNEYSASLKCYDCHVPRGSSMGLATTLNCLTSGCHGELAPDINHEEAIALKDKVWNYYPDARARIEHYLELHRAFAEDSCSSCHSEHQRMPIRIPDGWLRYEDMIKQRPADDQQASSEWRSVRSIGG